MAKEKVLGVPLFQLLLARWWGYVDSIIRSNYSPPNFSPKKLTSNEEVYTLFISVCQ